MEAFHFLFGYNIDAGVHILLATTQCRPEILVQTVQVCRQFDPLVGRQRFCLFFQFGQTHGLNIEALDDFGKGTSGGGERGLGI